VIKAGIPPRSDELAHFPCDLPFSQKHPQDFVFKDAGVQHSALFKCQNRPPYSDLIIVALETSNKIWMRGRRSFGVTVGVMAAQTFTIFPETLVGFGMQPN
jgi:hypothetical protein